MRQTQQDDDDDDANKEVRIARGRRPSPCETPEHLGNTSRDWRRSETLHMSRDVAKAWRTPMRALGYPSPHLRCRNMLRVGEVFYVIFLRRCNIRQLLE